MSAQNSTGIQTLLEAEKEAAKIVAKARQYRIQRLKDARTEAQKEIEQLKAQKLAEFQEFEKMHTGSSDEVNKKVHAGTEQELIEVTKAFAEKKDVVVEKLLSTVISCEPKLHINAKPGVRV